MEEYRNDNMEPASGENGEVRNVPQKERTEDPTVPFPGQTSATESTPAQDTPDVQKPTADPASWNHWSNAQPARQEPHQDTAGSKKASLVNIDIVLLMRPHRGGLEIDLLKRKKSTAKIERALH